MRTIDFRRRITVNFAPRMFTRTFTKFTRTFTTFTPTFTESTHAQLALSPCLVAIAVRPSERRERDELRCEPSNQPPPLTTFSSDLPHHVAQAEPGVDEGRQTTFTTFSTFTRRHTPLAHNTLGRCTQVNVERDTFTTFTATQRKRAEPRRTAARHHQAKAQLRAGGAR